MSTTAVALEPAAEPGPAFPEHEEQALQAFLVFAGKDSEHTKTTYQRSLAEFLQHLLDSGTHTLSTATTDDVVAWRDSLACSMTGQSVNLKLAALSSFYEHQMRPGRALNGLVTINPASPDQTERLAETTQHVEALTDDQARQLYEAARHSLHPTRDAAVLALLLGGALRVSEACAAMWEDLTGSTLTVVGKGKKRRRVELDADSVAILHEHLTTTRSGSSTLPTLKDQVNQGTPLVPALRGGRMYRQQMANIIAELGTHLDLDKVLTPHQLRATAITSLLVAGAKQHAVMARVGHSSPLTTLGYLSRHNETNEQIELAEMTRDRIGRRS